MKRDAYLPLSLSFVGVPLFDMLSDGDAEVVPEEDDDDGDDGVLGDMLLELLDVLPDGDVLDAFDEELDVSLGEVVDGDEVDGLIVLLLLLDDGDVLLGEVVEEDELLAGGVVDGVVVVEDVLLVSR